MNNSSANDYKTKKNTKSRLILHCDISHMLHY